MAQYSDHILFQNVSEETIKVGNRISNVNTDLSDPSDPYIEPIVNAVDIDWNGAVLKIA